ncbi:Stk1 family PASTA domain-containing Ser/Thr kinase [Thermostaphylospora chromogena]|uniref:non-specific serine/threonine protein kinase n=1 Tax=Thermostaphylospora chromogena TaxID=35622 RepID=A0A1H1G7N6_9ACTN|nr:Stk1 family PASTA domain-containing Ser/Thr kinase [Thermostaphylospora chromogena]SDR09272.1 serine/threonine protein kinase [Thermostaphylospora chromogena]
MDTTLADPLVGRLVDGRYRVESRIARGGMATVYLALDIRLDRTVALKVMHRSLAEDPAFVRRFCGEAKAAARLSHPNVVQVFDQGSDGDVVYLSMEHVPGRTLRDVLRERGRLGPREAVEALIPVLAALGAAHQIGMVHRDVKPENVLVTDDGRIKVVDFGLARAMEGDRHTRTGMMIGTIAYMSPEQVTEGHADPRSDVYAAGIMLFELVTGRQPYEGQNPMSVAYKHVHDTVPPPSALVPGTPPQLDALVARATDRDPDRRPADASAMLVLAVETHRSLPHDPEGSPPPPAPATQAVSLPPPSDAAPLSTAASPPASAPNRTLVQPRADLPDEETGSSDQESAAPARRLRLNWFLVALALVMVAAVAFSGWYFSRTSYVKVPADLVGKNVSAARSEAESRGFRVRLGKGVHDDKIPKDSVVRTEPAAGTEVETGSLLTLIPSLGPRLVGVPELSGLTEQEAKKRLTQAGLKVEKISRISHNEVQRGRVVRTSPPAGEEVKIGSKVEIVVSAGIALPDVRGMERDEAERVLQEKGFSVRVREVRGSGRSCTVIEQEPAAGTAVDKNETITLTVTRCMPEFSWPWGNRDDDGDGDEFIINVPDVTF